MPRKKTKTKAKKAAAGKARGMPRPRKSRGARSRQRAALGAALPRPVDVTSAIGIADFVDEAEGEKLADVDRDRIVDQALVLLQDFYVHLPLKRAMHACEPVQRLKLLRQRLQQHLDAKPPHRMSDRRFHDAMIDIFTSLRDLHTSYMLPRPYKDRVAFLPFMLEVCREDGAAKGAPNIFLVTKVVPGMIDDPDFRPGVEVTHWNGVPIARVVELSAAREPGSNDAARMARGLERLTVRALVASASPDEEWVEVGYGREPNAKEVRLEWKVVEPPELVHGDDVEGMAASLQGVDVQRLIVSRMRKHLFNRAEMEKEREIRVAGVRGKRAAKQEAGEARSILPQALSFRPVADGRYGYIRIWTFKVNDEKAFAEEFKRICATLPQDGLILDVRGNPGGYIRAGEMILQLLTPRRIEPARFQFVNSPRTLDLCQKVAYLQPWVASIRQSIETGAVYSQGLPLTDPQAANSIGQAYVGPVVLIVDALCYSTTDIFAAGFQDHGIGPVLGVDGNTGAGGANVWEHDFLRASWEEPDGLLKPLPNGAALRFAIRQSTRVGDRLGVPLEDLGVVPNPIHYLTRTDLLEGNKDLLEKAAAILDKETRFRLDHAVSSEAGVVTLTLTTANMDRVDIFSNGRATTSVDVRDGANPSFKVTPPAGTARLELKGYAKEIVVAARRIELG